MSYCCRYEKMPLCNSEFRRDELWQLNNFKNIMRGRFVELFATEKIKGATITGISFRRGAVKDYFYILQQGHKEKIIWGIENLLRSGWRKHFESILCYEGQKCIFTILFGCERFWLWKSRFFTLHVGEYSTPTAIYGEVYSLILRRGYKGNLEMWRRVS